MQLFKHARRTGMLIVVVFVTSCGGESITGPASSGFGSDPSAPAFDGEGLVEGIVRSGADGNPLEGARVTVVRWADASCHGIGCSGGWRIVEETLTDESGSYSLAFQCTGPDLVTMRVAGPGEGISLSYGAAYGARFEVAHEHIQCQETRQRREFTLEPIAPQVLVQLQAYLDATMMVTARSKWGLSSVSIDWGDGSPVKVAPASGDVQSFDYAHAYPGPGTYAMEVSATDLIGQTTTKSWMQPIGIGAILVQTVTTGTFDPADSYLVSVSGGEWKSIPAWGSLRFEGQVDGTVELADIPDNCTVSEPNPTPVRIFGGATNTVLFSVSCA
jgi:hypothetical protein